MAEIRYAHELMIGIANAFLEPRKRQHAQWLAEEAVTASRMILCQRQEARDRSNIRRLEGFRVRRNAS